MADHDFWRLVADYMTDPETTKRLLLDAVYTAEIDRPSGKACWCMRAAKTLTYQMHELARKHEVPLMGWFIAVVPTAAWPRDTSIHLLVIDPQRKHWGLHELMAEATA